MLIAPHETRAQSLFSTAHPARFNEAGFSLCFTSRGDLGGGGVAYPYLKSEEAQGKQRKREAQARAR